MTETYKRLRKNPLKAAGKTGDGRVVVEGFFKLVDGQGIPLDIVLHYFEDNGMVPCWLTFFMESLDRGWNPQSTLTRIQVACEDVYGQVHAGIVREELRAHVGL